MSLVFVVSVLVSVPLGAAQVEAEVQWARKAILGAAVSGVVETVHVAAGEQVTKDQALVTLDPRRFQARLEAAQAQVDRVKPELDEARRELDRARDLYDRTLLSDHDLQLAEIAFQKSQAEHRVALARLAEAKLRLERSVLRAPFAGVIVERWVEVGEHVAARIQSVPLVMLAETSRLLARALLGAEELAVLEIGQEIAVVAGDQELEGTVRHLSLEPVERTDAGPRYAVDVEFTPPASNPPRVGQVVTIDLP